MKCVACNQEADRPLCAKCQSAWVEEQRMVAHRRSQRQALLDLAAKKAATR